MNATNLSIEQILLKLDIVSVSQASPIARNGIVRVARTLIPTSELYRNMIARKFAERIHEKWTTDDGIPHFDLLYYAPTLENEWLGSLITKEMRALILNPTDLLIIPSYAISGKRVLAVFETIGNGAEIRPHLESIRKHAQLVGAITCLDRAQKDEDSALPTLAEEYGVPVVALTTVSSVVAEKEQQRARERTYPF